jgi:chemotaxis-related protein WspB
MLVLPVRLHTDRYAIDSRRVVEIIPTVPLRAVPHAPPTIAGLLNYRSRIIPVLDLRQLIAGSPCPPALSTRIMVVECQIAGHKRLLGLRAEHVTEAVRREPEDFGPSGLRVDSAPYLGGVAVDEHGMLQMLIIDELLHDPAVRDLVDTDRDGTGGPRGGDGSAG